MREFFGIVASLIKPAVGFVVSVLTFKFGWRPVVSVATQILLQTAVVLGLYSLSSDHAIGVIALLTFWHMLGAFRVFAIGLGLAFEGDRQNAGKGLTPAQKARKYWESYAISGYLFDVVPALFSVGLTLYITGRCTGGSFGTTAVAVLLSVFVGGIIDVAGVLLPLHRAMKKQDEQAAASA